MKESKTMRWMDRYLGSIICFFLSLLHKLRIKRKKDETKIKNILVIELFEMGAAIMAYSSLMHIKKKIPSANLYCITLKSMKESWKLLGIIPEENIYLIEEKNLFVFLWSLFKQIRQLRKQKIDLVIDFDLFMRITAIISFFIKTKSRAGFYKYENEGLYRGNYYDSICAYNQNMHTAKNFLALIKVALANPDLNEYPNYKNKIDTNEIVIPKYKKNSKIEKELKERIKRYFKEYDYKKHKIILICPDVGPNLSTRNYPKDKYVSVIKKILNKYPDKIVLLIGVKDNLPPCEYVAEKVAHQRCINFCAKTQTLTELFELMSFSELVITNDNGQAHFASITKTKTLAIFGPETPLVYGPLGDCATIYTYFQCSPCVSAFNHKRSICDSNLCVSQISEELVFDYVTKLIDGRLKYRTINNNINYLM